MQTESKPISDKEQGQGTKTDKFTPPYLQNFENDTIEMKFIVYELWIIIWNKKWWVICWFFAMIALAVLGSMVSFKQPIYKTEALLQAPRAEDIQLLNARIQDVIERFEVDLYGKYGVQKKNKENVFVAFKNNLKSRNLQNKFIKEKGVIELLTPQRNPKTKDEDFYKSFVDKMIKIENGVFTSVFIKLNDSRNIENLINAYIDFTDGETVNQLLEKIQNSIKKEIIEINTEIIRLQNVSRLEREAQLARIQKYEEAFQIATKLGIQDRDENECSSPIFRDPNYCLGSRTLGIEIEFLKKRILIDPNISKKNKLEQKAALLQTLKIKKEGFHSVSIHKSAHQSIIGYKTNRIRIIAIVTLFGLFSGIFLIYFVAFVENQRKKYSSKSAALVE